MCALSQLTLLEHQHELSESDRRTAELQLQVRQAEAKAATAEREAAEAKLREAEKREALMRTEASLKGLTAQCEVLRRGEHTHTTHRIHAASSLPKLGEFRSFFNLLV